MPDEALFTQLVRKHKKEIKNLLGSNINVVEKVVKLRMLARDLARNYFNIIQYNNIEEFQKDYDQERSPLVELEGPGIRYGDLIILKNCPSVPLFDDFKENGSFPDYWTDLPKEFMDKFRNEAILHPLCIVHQTFRDLLASQIPKGKGVVHSIAVACRSGTGKVVYSEFGMMTSGVKKDELDRLINGFACAFQVR